MTKFDQFLNSRRAAFAAVGLGSLLAFRDAIVYSSLPGLIVAALSGLWVCGLLLSLRAIRLMVMLPERRRLASLLPIFLLFALALMREGKLGEALSFDVNESSIKQSIRSDAILSKEGNTVVNASASNGTARRLALGARGDEKVVGSPLRASIADLDVDFSAVESNPEGRSILVGFREYFTHFHPAGSPLVQEAVANASDWTGQSQSKAARVVELKVQLVATDASCYLPLYKSATVPFEVTVLLDWDTTDKTGQAPAPGPVLKGHGKIAIKGQIKQTIWGICSCREFNQSVGHAIEHLVGKQINDFVRN